MMASQTIKEKIVELQKSKQTPQNSRPKIQRVAEDLRNRKKFEKLYSPKLVSIGPIHHGNTNLKLGEKYKLMWAAEYIENTRCNPEDLHRKIADNIDELKSHFCDDVLTLTGKSLEGFGSLEEKLSWILFVDGCSLLNILEQASHSDEIIFMNIKVDQLLLVITDVLLLENQLPYAVLKLLWKDNNDTELIKSMLRFLIRCSCFRISMTNESQSEKEKEGEGEDSVAIPDELQSEMEEEGAGEHSVSITYELSETPTHLLDLQREIIICTSKSKTRSHEAITSKEAAEDKRPQKFKKLLRKIKIWSQKLFPKIKIWSKENSELDGMSIGYRGIGYRGIDDLRAVGIRLKSSLSRRQTDIDFSEGWFTAKLTIPMIFVNNPTAAALLNLIAYEMCPDFYNDYGICSYISFMDSLIDHPEDVKALRSKGILCTRWSDEEVANLFNTIGTDLVRNLETYQDVRVKLVKHYRNKYKSWIALGFRTYFNNPWTVIAFLTAFIALALTFIQTLFTIHPAST